MPIPTPSITTALENSLDMCFSALYMHELHRKYHHGEYMDLDNVKEESEDGGLAGNEDNDENQGGYNDSGPRQPLLKMNKQQQKPSNNSRMNRDSDDENENDQSNSSSNNNSNLFNKSAASSAHFSNV